LDFELADDDQSAKMVFESVLDGRIATFETGSFLSLHASGDVKHDICVSTAGGCTRRCTFCATVDSVLGFERLLSWSEIVHQVDIAVEQREDSGAERHIVGFMGNGEPPDNPDCERAVYELMERPYDVKRIALSTIGENLRTLSRYAEAFGRERGLGAPVILHFSLHVADDYKRRRIIPGRKKIEDIVAVLDSYAEAAYDPISNPLPVHMNVVLMEDPVTGFSNATIEDADKLSELYHSDSRVSGTSAHRQLKLAAYNPIPGKPFMAPAMEVRRAFVARLAENGVPFYTFRGGGIEIDDKAARGGFACGQLRVTTAKVIERRAPEPLRKSHEAGEEKSQ
jgi:adenine C2-methylase RlmN of 23S rRNA A2503 and tRNA A37